MGDHCIQALEDQVDRLKAALARAREEAYKQGHADGQKYAIQCKGIRDNLDALEEFVSGSLADDPAAVERACRAFYAIPSPDGITDSWDYWYEYERAEERARMATTLRAAERKGGE